MSSWLRKRYVSTEAKSQLSFLRRALQIRKNGARPPKRSSIHFSMICAGTPRPNGEQRLSCYEIGDERSGSLADLPGAWGAAAPHASIVAGDMRGGNGAFFVAGSLSTRTKKASLQISRPAPLGASEICQRGGIGGGSRSPAKSINQKLIMSLHTARDVL